MILPPAFKRIRMERAREPGLPEGSHDNGYSLTAPLDNEGRIDADLWRAHREACRVWRYRAGEDGMWGLLIRRPGGQWAFHYEGEGGYEDDDPGYRLGEHRFVVGEYVTLQEDEGPHTYRIISVDAA